jgi:AcrR family transcriptional regulator
MGRKRTIDRNAILDAAEVVVTEKGAGSLSFDEVARRSGVSKGGVLYCFPSKVALIAAMASRDLDRFERDVAAHRGMTGDTRAADLLAYLAATRHESGSLAAKAASLLAALVEAPEHAEPIRDYYRRQTRQIEDGAPDRGAARVAFFAAEGAFLLRGLGLVDMDEAEWSALFDDLDALGSGTADRVTSVNETS